MKLICLLRNPNCAGQRVTVSSTCANLASPVEVLRSESIPRFSRSKGSIFSLTAAWSGTRSMLLPNAFFPTALGAILSKPSKNCIFPLPMAQVWKISSIITLRRGISLLGCIIDH